MTDTENHVCDNCPFPSLNCQYRAVSREHEAAILRRVEILRDLGEPVTRGEMRAEREQAAWEGRR